MKRTLRYRRCDNCFFSVWMTAPDRPVLICMQKVNFVGRWRGVVIDGACGNFYPSNVCKTGARPERRIPLTRGKFALVDADDYYRLVRFRWHAVFNTNTFYATSMIKGKKVAMHRMIMGAPKELVVDHIDRNGLNNRKGNLRLCSTAQNRRNTRSNARGTSRYKGVCWHKRMRKWAAAIQHDKKIYHIGYFSDQIAAAKAYDEKAREFFGEYAYLNFPASVLNH